VTFEENAKPPGEGVGELVEERYSAAWLDRLERAGPTVGFGVVERLANVVKAKGVEVRKDVGATTRGHGES
jgi:hypothetical protein